MGFERLKRKGGGFGPCEGIGYRITILYPELHLLKTRQAWPQITANGELPSSVMPQPVFLFIEPSAWQAAPPKVHQAGPCFRG